MRLAVLTTDTSHHTFFVSEIKSKINNVEVICDLKGSHFPKFETSHNFEKKMIDYENQIWFSGKNKCLGDICSPIYVNNINDQETTNFLKKFKPEAVVVFGTGRISKEIIQNCPKNTFNLHGGDPEHYRGLDSHLWAIYHNDFKNIKTTLHYLDQFLDNGEIVTIKKIPINNISELYMLRSNNARVCVELTLNTLQELNLNGIVKSKAQEKIGRYYSFMPKVLKDVCLVNFKKYINREGIK